MESPVAHDHAAPGKTPGPGERIKLVRQRLGLSQKDFSARLDLSQSTLSQIENDRYFPSYDTLYYMTAELGVDSNWLLCGQGVPYRTTAPPERAPGVGFPAVVEKARAGYSGTDRDEHWVSGLSRYQVPGFRPGADIVIFQVIGDSMMPTLEDQDFVLAERLTGAPESSAGHNLVMVVRDEIYVKRLANFDLASMRYTLTSDNPKYPTIEVGQDEVIESWVVVGRITRHLAPTLLNQDFRIKQLEGGMQDLQAQLSALAARMPGERAR